MNIPRRLTIVILLFSLSLAVRGQVLIALVFGDKLNSGKMEFGLHVGPNFSLISNSQADMKTGIALGLYFDIKLSDRFYFHPEAIPKSPYGGKNIPVYSLGDPLLDSALEGGKIERRIKYISLPLLMRYRITGSFFAEAGPSISLRTKVKDIFHKEMEQGDLDFIKQTEDEYTRFDFGACIGFVYKLKPEKGMGIGLRYYHGVIDVMKTGPGVQLNNGFLAYISIPVGSSKAKAKVKE